MLGPRAVIDPERQSRAEFHFNLYVSSMIEGVITLNILQKYACITQTALNRPN